MSTFIAKALVETPAYNGTDGFYAWIAQDDVDRIHQWGSIGSPLGRGSTPDDAIEDLERRTKWDFVAARERDPTFPFTHLSISDHVIRGQMPGTDDELWDWFDDQFNEILGEK